MLRASQAFSQVAPVPDFSLGYACHRFVFPCRTSPSLTSFSGCGHGWLFPVCAHRWFIPNCACRWLFFGSPHKSVAGFFFRLRLSLISSKLNPSLTLLPARMSPSLTFFLSCAGRWPFSQVAPVVFLIHVARIADFFPGRGSRWLFPRLSMSQVFFPCRTSPWLTSFSGCGHCWLFPVCARRWFFPKCACRWLFFGSPHKYVAGFFFRLRPSLISSKLNLSLTLLPARTIPSLTFFSACAGRWHFSQVAPVAFFNSCCAHRTLFSRSRPSPIFP